MPRSETRDTHFPDKKTLRVRGVGGVSHSWDSNVSLTNNTEEWHLTLSASDAVEITASIRANLENLWDLIVAAYQGEVWVALGYKTWDEYCTKEFGDTRARLPLAVRCGVMNTLRDAGLSLRAIASATGYDKRTVSRTLNKNVPTPAVMPKMKEETVTGLDHKKYPQRRTVEYSFWTASYEVGKLSGRMVKLAGKGEFDRRKKRIREDNLPGLIASRDTLNEVIKKLEEQE